MRTLPLLACVSLVSLLAACGNPNDGYYDANGNYIAPPNATTDAQRTHSPSPDNDYRGRHHGRYGNNAPYAYDQRGYYDYNGHYVAENEGLNIHEGMFPPRGMCRVWFADRLPSKQPAIEPCGNITARVPAGAYVIYGG